MSINNQSSKKILTTLESISFLNKNEQINRYEKILL